MAQSYTKQENAAYMRKWRTDNPEKEQAIKRKHRLNMTEEQKEKERQCKKKYFDSHKEKQRDYYYSSKRKAHLKHKYGISPEQFAELELCQGGVCAICFCSAGTRMLDVDHDHKTGRVRGLLCWNCNALLGNAKDSAGVLEAAIAYLKNNTISEEGH